jgi:DNA-binding transcriptional LysR family regulator
MELDSTEASRWAVAEGLGIAVVSKHAAAREVASGLLAVRSIHDLALHRPLYILYHARRSLPPAARPFFALLRPNAELPRG